MPEALAVLFVTTVSVICYIAAKVQARNPAHWDARKELLRLRQQRDYLEQRLELAREENWGREMCEHLRQQLRATRSELAHMTAEMDDSVET